MTKSLNITKAVAAAANDKKANDIVILDMKNISMVSDEFIICSANSTKQVIAIADNIEEKLQQQGVSLLHKEGYREGRWILMDYGACIVNIFIQEERVFYNLEELWINAPKYDYN